MCAGWEHTEIVMHISYIAIVWYDALVMDQQDDHDFSGIPEGELA